MNNKEGIVSVWLARFDSQSDFNEYIKIHYDEENEEDIYSHFEKDFNLKYYDRSLVEAGYFSKGNKTLKELFDGSSYLEEYIRGLADVQKEYNAIIRIYDCEYGGNIKKSTYRNNAIEFYDNIKYQKVVDLSWMGL